MKTSFPALRGTMVRAAAVAAVLAGTAIVVPAATDAATGRAGHDGLWSVLIVTEAGECDRAYRYSMRIDRGTVRYQGDPGTIDINVAGKIDDRGRVNVSISRGQQRADGTGQIANDRGAGTWKGKSASAQCSGRWEAEKRGT
jgi:hypothetical protein